MALLVLDRDLIRLHAGHLYYARGLAYHRQGAVVELHVDGMAVDATVVGTRRYQVHAELTGAGLTAECSCPLGVDGVFCKHAVAVALAWLDAAGDDGDDDAAPPRPAPRRTARSIVSQSRISPRSWPASRPRGLSSGCCGLPRPIRCCEPNGRRWPAKPTRTGPT
ncbi:SWIM zinc finger family protein [Candidatus Protofrankia datiscae]|uniref:SWIM zinc finger family protein n=1 Tax=Candidatus Protofrankia californiensis TaxID=1839754 RepID=UPI0010417753